MEKYNGQSGIFKVDNYNNMLALIGGDNEHLSEIGIGTHNISVNDKKEVGLSFYKCNREGDVAEKIEDFDEVINESEPSFIFIPRSKKTIDFLIECLNDLKTQF